MKKRKSNFFADFKKFISKGNIIDLAVAVIIGGAFGKIVTSLVDNIIMPLLSLVLGGKNFSDLKWVIQEAQYNELGVLIRKETALGYGVFIQNTIDFIIIAFCIFLIIRILSNTQRKLDNLRKKQQEEIKNLEPAKPTQEEILTEIRDLLKVKIDSNNQKE